MSLKAVSEQANVSTSTVGRILDSITYRRAKLGETISIDEFKGNAGGEKYQCIVTDVSERKIIDILPNRFESTLIEYFKKFSDREHVKFFVTDMNPHFRTVAKTCFPSAVIVADRYHVIRQVIWAMENVRKTEQKKLSKKFRKYFKKSRYLLNKPIAFWNEPDNSAHLKYIPHEQWWDIMKVLNKEENTRIPYRSSVVLFWNREICYN